MSQNINDNRKQWPGEYSDFNVADKDVDARKEWEPPTDYDKGGKYGKIRAYTWRAGHSVEIDETDGGERIRVIHPKGSYIEMQHDGRVIYRANSHSFEVVAGDKNLRAKGDWNIHISGKGNIKVDGDANVEVDGNLEEKIGGNWTVKVGGDITLQAGGTINFDK